MKKTFLLTLILFSLTLLFAGCTADDLESGIQKLKNRNKDDARNALRVKVLVMDSLSNYSSFTYVGNLEEGASVPMSLPAGGTVKTLNVKEGQHVRCGELLLTADATSVQSMLATARAKLAQAEDAYKRVKSVYEAGGVSDVKFVEVKTQLEEAQSTVEGLQKQVNDCSLRAPIDGVVCNCNVHVGQNLLPSQQAMSVVNTNNMMVKISVAENRIANMNIGDRGVVLFAAVNDLRVPCTICEKGILANNLTHTYDVKLNLNPDTTVERSKLSKLLPGMVAKVNIMSQSDCGFILPSYCIQNGHNQITVWVVRDGTAYRRQIEIGSFVDDNVFITGGLNQGDSVVVSGYHKLFSGAKVEAEI